MTVDEAVRAIGLDRVRPYVRNRYPWGARNQLWAQLPASAKLTLLFYESRTAKYGWPELLAHVQRKAMVECSLTHRNAIRPLIDAGWMRQSGYGCFLTYEGWRVRQRIVERLRAEADTPDAMVGALAGASAGVVA